MVLAMVEVFRGRLALAPGLGGGGGAARDKAVQSGTILEGAGDISQQEQAANEIIISFSTKRNVPYKFPSVPLYIKYKP